MSILMRISIDLRIEITLCDFYAAFGKLSHSFIFYN